MRKEFQVDAELIAGINGIFDVFVDGKRVFSRLEAGRFPEPGEISTKLAKS